LRKVINLCPRGFIGQERWLGALPILVLVKRPAFANLGWKCRQVAVGFVETFLHDGVYTRLAGSTAG
jgi:hypothetical protein